MSILSLNSYEDLLNKCKVELEQLPIVTSNPEYDYILLNIILGMNHLFEWYLKDENIDEKLRLQCVERFNPFVSPNDVSSNFKSSYKKIDKFPPTNAHQEVARKLCNKAKHFKKKDIEKKDKHHTAVDGSITMQDGGPLASDGAFSHYIYTVEVGGKDQDVSQIMSLLLDDWVSFTNK